MSLNDPEKGKRNFSRFPALLLLGLVLMFVALAYCAPRTRQLDESVALSIQAKSTADYSSDAGAGNPVAIAMEIVIDLIRESFPYPTDASNLYATFQSELLTPVPAVTVAGYETATGFHPTVPPHLTPEATNIPTATKPRATRRVTPTSQMTPTEVVVFLLSKTPTPGGMGTRTPTPTPGWTRTRTPVVGFTRTPSRTPVGTLTPSRTPTATVVTLFTHTPTPTNIPPTFTPRPPTPTFTRTPAPIHVAILVPLNGEVIDKRAQTCFEAEAWDPGVGSSSGAGISRVDFEMLDTSGNSLYGSSDSSGPRYCMFGDDKGNCYDMLDSQQVPLWKSLVSGATYIVKAQAYSTSGYSSGWVSVSFTKK